MYDWGHFNTWCERWVVVVIVKCIEINVDRFSDVSGDTRSEIKRRDDGYYGNQKEVLGVQFISPTTCSIWVCLTALFVSA